MRRRDWRIRVADILEAIDRVTQYIQGMDRATFEGDTRTLDAVVRNLEVIGEAVRHIPEDVQARHPEVPWVRMRGIGIFWRTSTSAWTQLSSGTP